MRAREAVTSHVVDVVIQGRSDWASYPSVSVEAQSVITAISTHMTLELRMNLGFVREALIGSGREVSTKT